jgi:hypothetical protein
LIVAALLVIGSLPFFFGLAVVVPVLGHSTWHLYRKVVEPDPSPREDHPRPPQKASLCGAVSGRAVRRRGQAASGTIVAAVPTRHRHAIR